MPSQWQWWEVVAVGEFPVEQNQTKVFSSPAALFQSHRKTTRANGKRNAFFLAGARSTYRDALSLRKERINVAFAAFSAFSQEEFYRQEVSGQAFGSFVEETTQDGINQKATYRYFFNKNNGVEANYGYSLNTQIYSAAGTAVSVKSSRISRVTCLCVPSIAD
jgi:hypothetical protein